MNYQVWIQASNGFPMSDWGCSAYLGFKDRQANIYFFENINQVPVSKQVILVASIENTNEFLRKLGLPPKKALNIPECLEPWIGRKIHHTTIENFLKTQEFPVFVKPDNLAKEFMAGVVSKPQYLDFYRELPAATKVLMSEVIDIVSEYRVYVVKGEIKGIKHYQGDFEVFPDTRIIKECIKAYKDAPGGYTADFAVTPSSTLLIEINDGFSIGNYGLDHSLYVTLLVTRWLEILKGN